MRVVVGLEFRGLGEQEFAHEAMLCFWGFGVLGIWV